MKKIMILGASIYQVPLIKKAKEMGLYTIVCSIEGNYPGFAFADKVYYVNTIDKEKILEVAKEEQIDGICTTGTDVAVITIGYVCEQMGLSGISYASAQIATNKAKMKQCFFGNGVPTAAFRVVHSEQEALEAFDALRKPVVMKIVDKSGSRGIYRVDDRAQVAEVFADELKQTGKPYIVIEEFINGHEVGVDALVQNGFQKFEAENMILPQAEQQMSEDDLFGQKNSYDYENTTTTIQLTAVPETPPQFSMQLAAHATYDAEKKTITFKRSMSPENRNELRQHFPQDKARIDQGYIESNRFHPERLSRIEMGYELHVPQLCVQETPDLLLPFDETTIYERMDYDRRDLTEALLKLDYHSTAGEITIGQIGMNQQGQITTQTIRILQNQSFAWDFDAADKWSEAELVNWIDERLDHPDIDAPDMTAVLSGVISNMITTGQMKLQQLVVDKYILLKSFQNALSRFRNDLRNKSYQQFLLPQCDTPLTVNPDCCFKYSDAYPVNIRYSGTIKFNKHLYSEVGDLNNEEAECAQKLDLNPKVDCWVRNLDRREQDSFWLQTSTDKFYPDFVCKLTDGRILVVEYKGHHLYSNQDSTEKRTIGELWANRSKGKCLFIMTDGKNIDELLAAKGL